MHGLPDHEFVQMRHDLGITSMPVSKWLILCKAWTTAEGGNAKFDPFNTTQREPGSTDANSVGVQNYPSAEEGRKATVDTLKQPQYASVLAAIRRNASLYYIAVQIGQSPWGTDLALFCRVLADNYNVGAGK